MPVHDLGAPTKTQYQGKSHREKWLAKRRPVLYKVSQAIISKTLPYEFRRPQVDLALIANEYIQNGKSAKQIGRELRCSHSTY